MKSFIFISVFFMLPLAGCYVNQPSQDARYANPPAQEGGEDDQEAEGKNSELPPPAPGTSESEETGPVDPGPGW